MGRPETFRSPDGGADYLILRSDGQGHAEIVYDDGVARHIVWRVLQDGVSDARLRQILRGAVRHLRVVPALLEELRRRAIPVIRIAG